MNTDSLSPKVHHGRNIKRLREILGVKQDTIAFELNMTQQNLSRLEQKEVIEDDLLEKIASILKLPVEAIKNFNDETTVNIVANTFTEQAVAYAYQYNFNPIDKIIELYERIVQEKDEKHTLLEKLLEEKK